MPYKPQALHAAQPMFWNRFKMRWQD